MPGPRHRGPRRRFRGRAAFVAALGLAVLPVRPLPAQAFAAEALPALVADPAALVDPLIGTSGGINTFPGPDMPFGMLQWGPDTVPDRPDGGGYAYGADRLSGFSLTHLSGPGCPAAGDVPVLPVTGPLSGQLTDASTGFRHADEHTGVGSYAVTDASGVTTELTSATRAGLGRFTFPGADASRLLFKLKGGATRIDGARARLVGDRELVGSVDSGHFCGAGNRYTLHFDFRFDRPVTGSGSRQGRVVDPGATSADGPADGMYLDFDTSGSRTVTAAVGVSYTDDAGAAANLEREIGSRGFADLRRANRDAWNSLPGFCPEAPGTDTLVLGSPASPPRTEIALAGGRTLRILAPQAAPDAPYVRALRVNGRSWQAPWLSFAALRDGATLDHTLGTTPDTRWGSAPPPRRPRTPGRPKVDTETAKRPRTEVLAA
ncbi:glycoside hydrolase domain-containing protein [Streptomyces gamaensis]|uniref:Glycoside hydrolase domain-containing protein n=1 Tax=Streptomyces gamaensis TaxID=1763542 RepID=A0ABW0YWG2_9ACTN